MIRSCPVGFPFTWLIVSLVVQKPFNFMNFCPLMSFILGKWSPIQKAYSYTCILEGTACVFSQLFQCFGFRSLIQLELVFVQGDRHRSNFILWHVDMQFPSTIRWRCILFSSICFWHLCQILKAEVTCTCVWVFNYVPLVYVSVFVFMPYCFYYYGSIILLKIWNGNPSSIDLFAKDFFYLLFGGLLWFPMNFRIVFPPISLKNEVEVLIGITLSL